MKKIEVFVLFFAMILVAFSAAAQENKELNTEFSYSYAQVNSFKNPIEKALWNDDRLEVTVLYNVNCAVEDVKGIAKLNGDTVQLFLNQIFSGDARALCESVHRGVFIIKDLKRKDYKILFNNGYSKEIFLKKDEPFITEPPEIAAEKNAEIIKEKDARERERKFTEYTRAIETNPRDANAYYWRSFLWWGKGDRMRAIDDLNKSLEIDPDMHAVNVYRFRAEIYCELHEYDKAWDNWHKAQSREYQDSSFEDRLIKESGREK